MEYNGVKYIVFINVYNVYNVLYKAIYYNDINALKLRKPIHFGELKMQKTATLFINSYLFVMKL